MIKKIWSLAALMMLMAAPMMTSCSNDLDEVAPAEEAKENVVTLTIKMPEQAETRVGINDRTLKLTGWEQDDEVKVYHFDFVSDPKLTGGIAFKCTNPLEGTFTGTLPAGKTLDDYNFAVYGRDVKFDPSISEYVVFSANEVYDNLKKCICLAGPIDNGSCTMTIYNNVIKVTNHKSPVTGAWIQKHYDCMKLYGTINDRLVQNPFGPGHIYKSSTFEEAKITIPTGESYIFMPQLKGEEMGFYGEDGSEIIPERNFANVVGKLYKVTIGEATSGRQLTRINDVFYGVDWVQLWEDGPKFAVCNVGFKNQNPSAVENYGGYYAWGGNFNIVGITGDPAYNTGTTQLTGDSDTATKLWGTGWRMPTKEEFDALLANCDSEWTTVNGVAGRQFTGKDGVYTSNSIFLPAAGYCGGGEVHSSGTGFYLTSTPTDNNKAYYLLFNNEQLRVTNDVRNQGYSIRPVLAK